MAEIVLGFAASHGPTMNTPPDKWLELGQKDVQDVRYDYASLRPKDGIGKELDPELMHERYAAVHTAIDKLRDVMFDAKPDVIVVFSNPHGGVAQDRQQPTFAVHLNDAPPFTEAPRGFGGRDRTPRDGEETPARIRDAVQYPTDGDLAHHLLEGLIEEGIDVAANFQSRPGAGLDEAYNLLTTISTRTARSPTCRSW